MSAVMKIHSYNDTQKAEDGLLDDECTDNKVLTCIPAPSAADLLVRALASGWIGTGSGSEGHGWKVAPTAIYRLGCMTVRKDADGQDS